MPLRYLGFDFQLNVDDGGGDGILGNQVSPQVTTLTDGTFAVVYQSDFLGNSTDIDPIAALFNTQGNSPLNFDRVDGASQNQYEPVVAARLGGGFGVAFADQRHADGSPDANPTNITYVPVAADGSLGTRLAIGDFNLGSGHDAFFLPAIATLSTGRQVVAFERTFTTNVDDDIYLNVVSADGLTTQFNASSPMPVATSGGWQAKPAVATIGNFAVVVYEDGTFGDTNITAKIFDGASNTLGVPIAIADHATQLIDPKIAALDDHRYVIIYDDNGSDVYGRIFDGNTSSLSAEFRVNQHVNFNSEPAVATTADGGFLVTWASFDGIQSDIMARRYNSNGVAMGQQFIVNWQLADGSQFSPAVSVSGANAFFTWTDGQSRSTDTTPASLRGELMNLSTPPDFNDNGLSDMLWRNSSGALTLWDINDSGAIGASTPVSAGGSPVAPDASWSIASESDFNSDGRADLVWRNTSGDTVLWTMNDGATVKTSSSFKSAGVAINPDASWSIVASGNFDGATFGRTDLLWRNTSGALVLWETQVATIVSSGSVTSGGVAVNPDPSWSVAAVGDFDGDMATDLIWRNTSTGELAAWFMNGSSITSSAAITSGGAAVQPDASWNIAAVGDFNADGNADLLWRKSDGTLALWLMNGSAISSTGSVMSGGVAVNPTADWHIVETGDFNGDARTDILWRNDSGQMAEWLMNGNTITSSVAPSSGGQAAMPDASWNIQAKPTNFA